MSALIVHTKGDGVLGDTSSSGIADIAATVAAADRAVIHLHGGLVTKASATQGAVRLDSFYRAGSVLPIFFVWESGLWETIRNNPKEIFDEKLFQTLLKRLLKHAGGKILQTAGGRAAGGYEPLDDQEAAVALAQARRSEAEQGAPEPLRDIEPAETLSELSAEEEKLLKNELATSSEFQQAVDGVMLGMEVPPPPGARSAAEPAQPAKTHLSREIREELRAGAEPGARGFFDPASVIVHAVKILARIVRRFIRKRDHGLYTTVVEELLRELYLDAIGAKVWGLMKQDTRDTFAGGSAHQPRGGSLFLRELASQLGARRNAGQAQPRLSIVAHSAGAIWACHFLQSMAEMRSAGAIPADFRLRQLIFMAPACTCRLFAKALDTHAQAALFEEFRLYGLSDPLEAGYWEVPPLYPRSLLYLVSGLFEDEPDQPLAGMERYLSRANVYDEEEVRTVRNFLTKHAERTVWSETDGGLGLSSNARKHGGFDDTAGSMIETMRSVVHVLNA